MSEFVRRKERGVCYICGDIKDWKLQDAGHFVHRNCLDYDLRNIHCSCSRCNRFLHGNLNVYAEKLIKDYGAGIIEELNRLGREVSKPSREELQRLSVVLSEAIENL